MARLMRMLRSGVAGVAIALSTGAAIAAPLPQDGRQITSGDREAPEDYDWIDRADALWDAIGDAPPDYSFAFDNGEPWAWETAEGYWIIVEDTADGMRSYYFAPNAEGPFLTREAGHSFGYDDGEIAMVYDAGGGAMARSAGAAYFDDAERLYDRGVRLRRAVQARNWQPVDTTAWVDLSFVLIGLQNQWDEGRRRHPGWRRHRELPHVIAEHRRWDSEHRRRADAAERFRRWREGGFQGKPPGRPGGWVHGPHQPGKPGVGTPRPDGQPGRPGRPGRPGLRPPQPTTGPQPLPTVIVAPPAGQPRDPATRPPRGPRPGGTPSGGPATPGTVSSPQAPGRGNWHGEGRPGRPRPYGGRPTTAPAATPPAPAVPAAAPAAPATAPAVRPIAPTRPVFRPRPGENGATRPAIGRPRPTRPVFTAPAAPAPATPPAVAPPTVSPVPRPSASRPARPAPPPRPAKVDREPGKVE